MRSWQGMSQDLRRPSPGKADPSTIGAQKSLRANGHEHMEKNAKSEYVADPRSLRRSGKTALIPSGTPCSVYSTSSHTIESMSEAGIFLAAVDLGAILTFTVRKLIIENATIFCLGIILLDLAGGWGGGKGLSSIP